MHDYIEWRFLWSDVRLTVSLICAHGDICARNVEYAGLVIKALFHLPCQRLQWRNGAGVSMVKQRPGFDSRHAQPLFIYYFCIIF